MQHNVANWRTNKNILINTYMTINPDIILINSHGLKSDESLKILGYITHKINASNELNDGCAILVKSIIKHQINDNFLTDMLEMIVETSIGRIKIATTYIPPRRPFIPFPDFHALASNSIPTYLLADLNAKHTCLGDKYNNTVGKNIKRLMDENKLNHIGPNFPTYFAHNAATSPDIILANNQIYHNHIIEAGPITSSDHIPMILTITAKAITTPSLVSYNMGKANWDSIKEEINNKLHEIDTNQISTQQEIETAIETWYNNITTTMENNIPKTNKKTVNKAIQNNKIRQLQWYGKNLLEEANIRGWSYNKYIIYKTIKKAIVEESIKQYKENWSTKMGTLQKTYKNPKEFWKTIKRLKGNKTDISPYLLHNNTKVYDEEKKGKIFREIWSDIFHISPEENATFDAHTEEQVNSFITDNENIFQPHRTANLDRLYDRIGLIAKITIQEVKSTIKTLKNNTPGVSKINKMILNNIPDEALKVYTDLLNLSLSLGYFPKKFKQATIKLIPKQNKPTTNPINYRPISLLEVPGKIFEKIINKRLRGYIESNNTLPNSQHGFRPCRGTDTALAITTETIAHALASKNQCYIVLRDVAKAFDKVWHWGLKYKLAKAGLPDLTIKLLSSFLDDRSASINLENHFGEPFKLKSGVPQGSALSPTLYTIYTADTPIPSQGCTYIQYADDITQIITYPGKSKAFMANKIQREIMKINKYEKQWKIMTNTNKFKIIPLAVRKTKPINIDNQIIPYANEGSILGLHINRRGISNHLRHIKYKANIALNTIKRFNKLTKNIKLHLVKACVIPILTYPNYTLNSCAKTEIKALQRIQNKALRFALEYRSHHQIKISDLHEIANIDTINVILHKRGNQTKDRIINIIQDEKYTEIVQDNIIQEHGWFRRSTTQLNKAVPEPIYT